MSYTGSYYDPSMLSTDSASERSGRPAGPRRNTSSSIPPPRPLGLPEGRSPPGSAQSSVSGRPRSRSPLRKSHTTDDTNGQFPDARSSARGSIDSSRPSISDFASSFLKVGSNLMGAGSGTPSNASGRQSPNRIARKPVPQSPSSVLSRLTDAELEEEALREKEASRLEAERILTREAEARRRADERMLASLRPTNGSEASAVSPVGTYSDLPPTAGHVTPRKESGNSGSGWVSALAKKLTPTKEVTPAQQIIKDARAKDKEQDKEQKRAAKDKRKSQPSTPEPKSTDPAYLNLTQPIAIPSRSSPSAYSPIPGGSPGRMSMSSNTGYSGPGTPTPQRTHGPPGSSPILGPAEPTPLYAVFNPQGTLDIPATLLTVAKRFEKLEKWTVSHVRALEERMKDVEKYLIDRESDEKPDSFARRQLEEIKREMTNLQILLLETHTDLTELKNTPPVIHQTTVVQQVAPPPPQSAPSPPASQPSPPLPAPQPKTPAKTPAPLPEEDAPVLKPVRRNVTGESTTATRSLPQPPRPASAASSAFASRTPNGHGSPSMSGTPPLNSKPSRSRLPYPSGDYTSSGSGFSQPGSPSQFSSPGQIRRQYSGGPQSHDRSGSEYSIPERYTSPSPPAPHRQQGSYELAPPKTPSNVNSAVRATSKSPSPTPRKRYTVALSGREDVPSPNNATRAEGEVQTALFSDSSGESRSHSLEETGERLVGMFDFSPLVIGKHGRDASDQTDITATPPDREETQSPDPTIGGTSITLSRLSASPPPSSARTMSPKPTPNRPRSLYTMNSLSPSLKTVSSPQTVPNTQTSPRTPSLRARAQSTFTSLDSVSSELNGRSPGLGAAAPLERQGRPTTVTNGRPSHKRAQSQGIGLGINTRDVDTTNDPGPRSAMPGASKGRSTIVTPSGQPFVDPLVIRKKSKTNLQGTSSPAPSLLKSNSGNKIPVGQLVAFFDEKQG